jgi:hypothetical protein
MIVPVVIALPALAVFAAVGFAIDRALGWNIEGASRWIARILAGLVALLAIALHPVAGIALAVLVLLEARFARRGYATLAAEPSKSAVLSLVVFAAIACVRPAVPLYWDEHVWLSKVRLAGPFALSLRTMALDPRADIVPHGYPIVGSMTEAWFAFGRVETHLLVAGATALVLLTFGAAIFSMPERRRIPWTIALATAPLVWIHSRSTHLDLAVGFMALCFAMNLSRVRMRQRALPLAMSSGFLLAGMKDEGLLHVFAIGIAHLLASDERRRALRESALAIAPALVAALTWRILLWTHGVSIADHALEGAGISHIGAILSELVRALTDLRSWGLAWPIVLGTMLMSVAVRESSTRPLSVTLALSLVALIAGLLVGGERLVAFALAGTVTNRLLLELVPLAAFVAVDVLCGLPTPSFRELPQKSGG